MQLIVSAHDKFARLLSAYCMLWSWRLEVEGEKKDKNNFKHGGWGGTWHVQPLDACSNVTPAAEHFCTQSLHASSYDILSSDTKCISFVWCETLILLIFTCFSHPPPPPRGGFGPRASRAMALGVAQIFPTVESLAQQPNTERRAQDSWAFFVPVQP